MMRIILGIALALAACGKGKSKEAGPGSAQHVVVHGNADAGVIDVDWGSCEAALRRAATEPLDARPQIVIDGCKVCGDWMPLLRWRTPQQDQGPTRAQIETAMGQCNAYCDPTAKQRFIGTLDNARGGPTRTPWRWLGEVCKGAVSAVPDNRFTTAPYFALDRIGRAASAKGGEVANLLAAVELPLPAVSITGAGITLPDVETGVTPTAGPVAITLIGGAIHLAKLPRARLGANGVTVDLGNNPGDEVKAADLGPALKKLVAGEKTSIAILAPVAMPAWSLVGVIATAAPIAPVYLAVNAPAPEGWELPGTIPITLEAAKSPKDALVIDGAMTVQNLATTLATSAHAGKKSVAVFSLAQPVRVEKSP